MTATSIGGGIWLPSLMDARQAMNSQIVAGDAGLLDADEEEVQLYGHVNFPGGPGTSKTFGTSGSSIGWLPGASIAFVSSATLRVGIKTAVDTGNGPAGRATIGAAAFAVYDDLVGGTDTITSTTWRTDAMSAGTPFTLTHGDLIAVCFHLDTASGTQSIKVRGRVSTVAAHGRPGATLVTTGPVYTALFVTPSVVLASDDGTLASIDDVVVFSAADTAETVGNTNIYGNVFTPTVPMTVDAIKMLVNTGGTTNFDVGIWSTPAGTPTAVTGANISVDPQIFGTGGVVRVLTVNFTTAAQLSAGTSYLFGLKQNSATAIAISWFDVDATGHHQFNGLNANCYAVKSTAGASVSAQNSSKRRAQMWLRATHFDDGAGGGGGGMIVHPGMSGRLGG